MNIAELHPEELLDQSFRRSLSSTEQAHLDAHVARCSACALHVQLRDHWSAPAVTADDAAVAAMALARLGLNVPTSVDNVVGRETGLPDVRSRTRREAVLGGLPRWAAAAVALLLLSGVALAVWRPAQQLISRLGQGRRHARVAVSAVRSAAEELPIPPAPTAPATTLAATPAPPPSPAQLQAAAGRDVPVPSPARIARTSRSEDRDRGARRHTPDEVGRVAVGASATALFTALSGARQRSAPVEVETLYRLLEQFHAGTREELTARVLVAQVYLSTGAKAANAAGLLTSYLRDAPNGTLAEEARVGLATAYGRLEQHDKEREAWRELLRRHPQTLHRPSAEQRLEALR